jgi:hypothetical protein
MADMVIAYFNETWWLVRGELHLSDVLGAKEAETLEIEIRSVPAWVDVVRLWEAPEEFKMPWAINPKVIERVKTRKHTTVL